MGRSKNTLQNAFLSWTVITALSLLWSNGSVSQEQQKQIVLLGADVPPFSWQQHRDVVGINMNIVEHAAERLGIKVNKQIVPLKRALTVLNHQAHHYFVGLARTPEREELYQWIAPLISTRIGLLKLNDSTSSNAGFDDKQQYRAKICVHYDTPMQAWLLENNEADFIAVTNEQACLKLLSNKLVKYWFTEFHLARYLIKQANIPTHQIVEDKLIMQPKLYLATSLNADSKTIEQWRKELNSMASKGEFRKFVQRYVDDY